MTAKRIRIKFLCDGYVTIFNECQWISKRKWVEDSEGIKDSNQEPYFGF